MSKKYKYLWVTRDKGAGSTDVVLWKPQCKPTMDADGSTFYYNDIEALLQEVCVEEFRRVFGWKPKKGARYKVSFKAHKEKA